MAMALALSPTPNSTRSIDPSVAGTSRMRPVCALKSCAAANFRTISECRSTHWLHSAVRMAWIGVVEASPPFRKGRVSVMCDA
jgi:hypothetical protein